LDSVALIAYQQAQHFPLDLVVHVNYGQVAFASELHGSDTFCNMYGIPLEIVEEKQMHLANPKSMLLGLGDEPFIRGRNLWLIQLAAAVAIRKFGDEARINILLGLCKENMMFADANNDFIRCARYAMEASFGKVQGYDATPLVSVFAPLINVPKELAMKTACQNIQATTGCDAEGAVSTFFDHSFTCWTPVNGGECGKCYHCEKKEGLREKVEIELLGRRVLNK
jgi:7-cyano-7-deazaguanine synthase in queuosine biosynthesis